MKPSEEIGARRLTWPSPPPFRDTGVVSESATPEGPAYILGAAVQLAAVELVPLVATAVLSLAAFPGPTQEAAEAALTAAPHLATALSPGDWVRPRQAGHQDWVARVEAVAAARPKALPSGAPRASPDSAAPLAVEAGFRAVLEEEVAAAEGPPVAVSRSLGLALLWAPAVAAGRHPRLEAVAAAGIPTCTQGGGRP